MVNNKIYRIKKFKFLLESVTVVGCMNMQRQVIAHLGGCYAEHVLSKLQTHSQYVKVRLQMNADCRR